MATLVKIKYARQADHHPSVMRSVLSYCLNPEKTKHEQAWMVCGVNCAPETAYREFCANKSVWGKTDGVCFRHYVQSFHPNDAVTPEEMMQIGLEFACRAWPGYSVVIASHLDRDHKHNHFIIDTVHPEHGRKLHEDRGNIARLRSLNDEICKAHGLAVLSPFAGGNTQSISTREYRAGEKSESWKFRLRAAIKYAMLHSGNRTEFISTMRKLGYGVRWEDSRKHITYTCFREPKYKNGGYRKCRDSRLAHEKYTKENMEHEFEIRKKILSRRDDRYAQRSTDRQHTDGEDRCGTMESVGYDSGQYASPCTEDHGTAERDPNDTRVAVEDSGVPIEVADGANTNTDRIHEKSENGSAGNHREYDPKTGWESERDAYFTTYKMGESSKISMVGAAPNLSNSIGSGIVLGGLIGLSLLMGSGEPKTKEEAEREEEARMAGENLEALIALISLGIELAAQHKKVDADDPIDCEEPYEDEELIQMM